MIIGYRYFYNFPREFTAVPEWYSIHFNLRPINLKKYVELFKKNWKIYKNFAIKGCKLVYKNHKKLKDVYISSISESFYVIHKLISTWRLYGIYEILIDCPPEGYNLESLIPIEQLDLLEDIKKACTYELKDSNDIFYDLITKSIEVIKSEYEKHCKEKYLREVEELLKFKNFYEMMMKCVLQIIYGNPGIYRFKRDVVIKFSNKVKMLFPKKYNLFVLKSKEKLKGLGASPGVVIGKALIAHTLEEAIEKIKNINGKIILICPKTDPSWELLFDKIDGIVTEVGGRLSHAAIVAREYGIPCIVGVQNILKEIKDGDLIKIDGTAGEIKILKV